MLHLNCIKGHLLIEYYLVIVIECRPTSSFLYLCVICACIYFYVPSGNLGLFVTVKVDYWMQYCDVITSPRWRTASNMN